LCYSLTSRGKTIYVLAIDKAGNGFNIAKAAMNELTGSRAEELGVVEAVVASVDVKNCGL
jgi:hypothetical protein